MIQDQNFTILRDSVITESRNRSASILKSASLFATKEGWFFKIIFTFFHLQTKTFMRLCFYFLPNFPDQFPEKHHLHIFYLYG